MMGWKLRLTLSLLLASLSAVIHPAPAQAQHVPAQHGQAQQAPSQQAPSQPVQGEAEMEEDPTCGLTFAQIPLGLTQQQANAAVMAMSPPRNRLEFEMLDGLVWRYGLTAPYAKVIEWLPAARTVNHRLQLFSTLALLGAGKLKEPEALQLQQTLTEIRGNYDWKQLFAVLARLDTDRFDRPALDRLRQVITSLGTSDDDYSRRIERLNLEALHSEQEFRLLAARKVMSETLAMPRNQRLAHTADLYAELDGGFSEILTPWAAGRLVRETWSSEPAEQSQNSPKPELVHEVAEAVRDCLKRASSPTVTEHADERLGIKLRLLRVLRHIGADLSPAELGFIAKNNGHHIDRLD